MMRYSQDALDEMAQKIDLYRYASGSVTFVRRSGDTHFAVCPFHSEKTASLAIKEGEGYFHCFGCGKSGNIYTWIQLIEGLSFKEAVEKVAALTNTESCDYVESETINMFKKMKRLSEVKPSPKLERTILDIDKDYHARYSDTLPQEWLDEGIPEETMKKYDIRVDEYSNRIVYPVYDAEFRLIGVKGRTRFQNYKELKMMKYLNYFKIGQLDYFTGMKQAIDEVRSSRSIIIVEGIKSVM